MPLGTRGPTDVVWFRKNNSALRDAGKPIPFQSILDATWWAVGTLTTGGFGDVIPYTDAGRLVSGLCMLCNLLLNSYPITIICITFSDVWTQYQRVQLRKNRRKRLLDESKKEAAGQTDDISHGISETWRKKAN